MDGFWGKGLSASLSNSTSNPSLKNAFIITQIQLHILSWVALASQKGPGQLCMTSSTWAAQHSQLATSKSPLPTHHCQGEEAGG